MKLTGKHMQMQEINNKFIRKKIGKEKNAFNNMSAERFLDDYGYNDETGKNNSIYISY